MFNSRAKGIQESINPNLLSGFVNAVRGMLQVSANTEIEAMNLSGQKLIFQVDPSNKQILFIARVLGKSKESKIKKQLQKIGQDFLTKYAPQLKKWNCDTSIFDGFEKEIAEYLSD